MQHAKVQSATLHLHEDEVLHEAVGNVLYNAMSTVKDWGVCNLHVRRVQVAEKSDILSNAKKRFCMQPLQKVELDSTFFNGF